MKIIIATQNPHKVEEIKEIAKLYNISGIEFLPIDKSLNFNPVEDGETFEENSIIKAKEANNGSVVIPSISILFGFNSSAIPSTGNELLKEYAKAYMQTNKEAIILVEGFACNIGDNEANNWISEQRAKTIQQKLISAGIPQNKVEVKWYGKSRFNEFKYSNKSEYRRVILSIK